MNERALLPLSASSFSLCLLSLVGLLLRKTLVWILLLLLLLFSFSSLSPLPSSPFSVSLPLAKGLQLSRLLPRSHVFLSPLTPPSPPLSSPLSPAPPTSTTNLRMSCEEAQLHKERLQALAVSQSVFEASVFCFDLLSVCFWCLSVCLSVTRHLCRSVTELLQESTSFISSLSPRFVTLFSHVPFTSVQTHVKRREKSVCFCLLAPYQSSSL